MMKRLLVVASFVLLPSVASAQGYIEGSIGAAFVGDVSTQVPAGFVPDAPSGTVSADVGTELLFGAELGFAMQGGVNTRWGVSWDHSNVEADGASISFGGLNISANCAELALAAGYDVCAEAKESVHVIAGNVYLDLPVGDQSLIQPFIGVGAGYAFFQDADGELALSASAGARIPLSNNAYVGGRYRFQWISGPTDDFGIEYDAIKLHGVSAILGFQF